mmetsp:Transcript_32869/g.103944  ORF Transcript_32869/g.103944 Transcript_32869/m.103944 type:complete len:210 (+) Transcript_32869:1878-2507(+)
MSIPVDVIRIHLPVILRHLTLEPRQQSAAVVEEVEIELLHDLEPNLVDEVVEQSLSLHAKALRTGAMHRSQAGGSSPVEEVLHRDFRGVKEQLAFSGGGKIIPHYPTAGRRRNRCTLVDDSIGFGVEVNVAVYQELHVLSSVLRSQQVNVLLPLSIRRSDPLPLSLLEDRLSFEALAISRLFFVLVGVHVCRLGTSLAVHRSLLTQKGC